jgi:predicted Zn-dependent protease
MDEVLHQQKMIEKYGAEDNGMNEDIDYDKAQNYCKSILKNCPLAVNYMAMRVMYLLKSNQLKEAEAYSKELVERTDIPYTQMSILQSWRARVMIYSGNEVLGEKLLR